ncbi:hypothetical protein [Actinoplanes sp. OR16]|uniref:hypothetical protein n=1 Tax=Actinoplanes sp. OR16 TaxID=946334 RepID=UPI000FDAA68A|nr:hypothetical protein [Actinoplanes sp. OR16]
MLALAIVGGTILLVRPLIHEEERPAPVAVAPPAAATSDAELPVEITPEPSQPPSPSPSIVPSAVSKAPATTKPPVQDQPPAIEEARFELTTGVTELSVRTSELDDPFRVSAADDSGLTVETSFDDGVLRVAATSDGSGSGKLTVRLSDRIVWHLRLSAGVKLGEFDMGSGTVSRIDLDGGAERFALSLGRISETLPIRMTGGVSSWRIETAQRVPVRVRVGNGAGDVILYGDGSGGVGSGKTIRSGDLDDRPGLAIDAEAGMGSLEVTED